MFTCFSSWEKQRKWQKKNNNNNSQKNLLTHPITTFSHRLFQLALFSHKYGVLKKYGNNYGWKTWKETGLVTYGQASHLLFHVVLDPALLFDVQSLLQLVYLQLKFKQSVQCHLVQIVCYTFTLSKLFAFKSVFILKRSKAFICYVSWILTWVPPEELNLFEMSQSHLQANFPSNVRSAKHPNEELKNW